MLLKRMLLAVMVLTSVGLIVATTAYDSDGDGVDDHLDVCCATPEGVSVDEHGRPLGDVDLDCDVDLIDFAMVQANFTGQLYPCSLCDDSYDCPANQYCARVHDDCHAEGTCAPRPIECSDVWEPVCACNGETYDNGCLSALAGQSINYEGECEIGCLGNYVCDVGDFCKKEVGDCDGVGECEQLPLCLPSGEPSVCGCDGVTYADHCYAHREGVSVAYEGSCE